MIRYVLFGAVFWLVSALFIRFTGSLVFEFGSLWLTGLFLITIPLSWEFIWGCLKIFGYPTAKALPPVLMMCVTGMLLDGIAITNFPILYGEDNTQIMLGAAWLLWGVAVLLVVAMVMDNRFRVAKSST